MHNYLNILLIIITLFVVSCSKNPTEAHQVDDQIQLGGSIDNKYNHLYNSLYIHIALERNLNKDALRVFVKNIDVLKDTKLYKKISKISLNLYDYKKSEIIAKRWLIVEPNSYSPYQFAIKSSLDNSDIFLAEKYFESYIKKIQPINKSDYSKLIYSLFDNKNRLNVIQFFENYLNKNKNQALNLSFIELLYSYNMPSKVIYYIDKIGSLSERNLVRLYANSLLLLHRDIQAKDLLENFLQNKPSSDRQVEYELLGIYALLNDMVATEKLIKDIFERDPDNPENIYRISRILYENKKYNLSEKYLAAIVSENDEVNILRGLNDYELGNYTEAINHYERVSNYNLKIIALIHTSSVLVETDSIEKAILFLDNHINKYFAPTIKERFMLKQISLLNEYELYGEIIELSTKYLNSKVPSPNLLYARAMAYEELREIKLMEKDLTTVLLIDQKNANTLNALGYSLAVHTQRYDEAYELIHEAHLYDPGSAAILDSLGWVEYKRGNYVDALKFVEASYERDKDKEIILHYCEILIKNKSYNKLKNIIHLELERNSDDESFVQKLNSMNNEIPL
ncbi:MAG: tetratricopeptide (TPR) repeat protein [Gammaproteobacteria bacterium]|jgi:tetratricopeptide (TPR) repeat protein